MNNPANKKREGRAASLAEASGTSAKQQNERREGNRRLSSRILKKATEHMPSHKLAERWFIADANGQILGRFAVKIARLLMGKDQASFNRAVEAKTNVIVINAELVKLTGNKLAGKIYTTHTTYPGGLNTKTAGQILAGNNPGEVVRHAVAGMLPKNKLHNKLLDRLKIYTGDKHPHSGQNPVKIDL